MLLICYPKCSTCQKAKKWLDGKDIAYTERNIAEDVQYILRTCSQVIRGILQLSARRLGRENILFPAAC